MKIYEVRDRKRGTVISSFYTEEDAKNEILNYEEEDREDNIFKENSYEIVIIEMKYYEFMTEEEFCDLLSHYFERPSYPIRDLCPILECGDSTNKYSDLGNSNTEFDVEYRNKYLKRTEKITVFEIADYDNEKYEYTVKGYIVEP